jgi:hypothetical protein
MKKPKVERGPNVSMPIRQPQTMITSGVRQPASGQGRRTLSSVVANEKRPFADADAHRRFGHQRHPASNGRKCRLIACMKIPTAAGD